MDDDVIIVKTELKGKYSDKVANLISYFTLTLNYLSQIRLVKLIYLSELYNIQYHKHRISDADFYKWHYGPWSPDIEMTTAVIAGSQIKLEESETKDGHSCTFIKPNVKKMDFAFTEKDFFILENIIRDWKYIPTKTLISFTKNSDLFLKTKKWGLINLNEYLKEISMPKTNEIPVGNTITKKILGYTVNILREKDGYTVEVPKLDGCYTQADSYEELVNNVRDAILSYLTAVIKLENDPTG